MTRTVCIERLAQTIAGLQCQHPTRVGIDGVDGVGKTTLANEIAVALTPSGRQIIRASVDSFHLPREIRYRRGADSGDTYFEDSFDYSALRGELIDPLGPGGTRRFRAAIFDHRSNTRVHAEQQTAAVDAILLFDGVFLQRRELADVWDLVVWVDAPFEVTVPRAIERDAADRVQRAEIRLRYERRYVPGQRMYIEQCRPRAHADIVVDNSDVANPQVRYQTSTPLAGRE